MKTKILSVGCNRKLGKKIGVMNLPAQATCPGRTVACSKCCYAMKAEKMYPSARAKRAANLAMIDRDSFVSQVSFEIQTNKLAKVRVHESGDWVDQAYLDKWFQIAELCPDTKFLAFTKSFQLDFSKRPENMVIYASVDVTTDPMHLPAVKAMGVHLAELLSKGAAEPPIGYVCRPMTVTKKHNYCGDGCDYCWDNKGPVFWPQH